jgi:predicted Zn-dependent protease
MKHLVAPVMLLLLAATSAEAQIHIPSGVTKGIETASKSKEAYDSLTISADEERTIGEGVSDKLRARFGVVQDPAIHKYVTLVGTAVAEGASSDQQPKKGWVFIVLDTDGVNAFAAPGGFVHITRGAMALIKNESELASVLGHEIGHVTHKHTINAIKKSNAIKVGADAAGSRSALLGQVIDLSYNQIVEGTFDRGDEIDADSVSTQLAPKAGYASTLDDFLKRLDDRNKNMPTRNGLFASHPATAERIEKLQKLDASIKTTAMAEARYKSSVHYELAPVTSIATVPGGASGLADGGKDAKADDKNAKKEEPKKGNSLTNALSGGNTVKASGGTEKQSASATSSGGSRGVGPDRDAKGGSNPALVKVSVTAAEVAAFKKSIA